MVPSSCVDQGEIGKLSIATMELADTFGFQGLADVPKIKIPGNGAPKTFMASSRLTEPRVCHYLLGFGS